MCIQKLMYVSGDEFIFDLYLGSFQGMKPQASKIRMSKLVFAYILCLKQNICNKTFLQLHPLKWYGLNPLRQALISFIPLHTEEGNI